MEVHGIFQTWGNWSLGKGACGCKWKVYGRDVC
jgi:hypothetical protein